MNSKDHSQHLSNFHAEMDKKLQSLKTNLSKQYEDSSVEKVKGEPETTSEEMISNGQIKIENLPEFKQEITQDLDNIEALLPLSCPLCDKQFLSSQVMHDHFKTLHLITSEARIVLLIKESKNY